MKRQIRLLLVSLLATLVVLVPGVASAHDTLLSTDPVDGAKGAAPDAITLTFSGEVAQVGATVAVTGGDGAAVTDGAPQVEGTTVVQPLVDGLAAGDYEVVWRVTSQDGHPISGSFGFGVEGEAAEGVGGGTDQGAAAGGAAQAAAGSTDEASTDEATAEEATAEETTPAADADEPAGQDVVTRSDDAQTGLPGWVWVVVGLSVVGLLALLGVTWSRNRR